MSSKYFFIACILFILHFQMNGQEHHQSQVVRGRVIDKQTRMPLPGANVLLADSEPLIATATNEDGEFWLKDVPLGRQSIVVSFIGYHNGLADNLIVISARETVLLIEMEEKVEVTGEVIVSGNIRKDLALNQMAGVSARSFTVEEAGRYAGTREDVARMAMNFAGVSGANDSRNDIVIRGNTPGGILWRLEDVDIPNPNHFAASGTTGGPVGMLNNNTLRNSDFFTGAFPAEYSNVFSGVFDLKMREGNNEHHEFLGQVGFNGFELGAEGPFNRNRNSSFLANYRYSTLQVFDLLGINFGTAGIPNYQDLSLKMNFPLQKGRISVFALAGISAISMLDSEENKADLYSGEGMDLVNGSSLVASGVNYLWFHNENTYSKFVLSYINQNGFTEMDEFDPGESPEPYYRENNYEERLSFRYVLNKKFSRKFANRSGLTIDRFGYSLKAKIWDEDKDDWESMLNNRRTVFGGTDLLRSYTQFIYKFSDAFEIKPGVSFMYFGLNDKFSFEPRFGASLKTGYRTRLHAGYGKHSRIQSLATYFLETVHDDGSVELKNRNLDFTKAHHVALGFDALLSDHLRVKAETYYQYLYDVPVEDEPSYYSIVNAGADWGLNARDSMVNAGEAWNYGVEFTLERFYHRNYYFLVTTSLFESKYTGSDGVKRNTAFNGNFVVNGLAGREVVIRENATLVFDVRITWAGGKRYIPIDEEASKNSSGPFNTQYFYDLAYSEQFADYLKADVKIGFRRDGKKVSQLWEFYIENITNHKNPLSQSYSKAKERIETVYQLGFFPLFNYRIYF
jgi:hypothetical protein